jgi:hypothetical protein
MRNSGGVGIRLVIVFLAFARWQKKQALEENQKESSRSSSCRSPLGGQPVLKSTATGSVEQEAGDIWRKHGGNQRERPDHDEKDDHLQNPSNRRLHEGSDAPPRFPHEVRAVLAEALQPSCARDDPIGHQVAQLGFLGIFLAKDARSARPFRAQRMAWLR